MNSNVSGMIKQLESYRTNCNKVQLAQFITSFYQKAELDFSACTATDLLQVLEKLYNFLFNRLQEHKVEIIDAEDGHSSILMVVAKETPFVIESITAELLANNLNIKNYASSIITITRNEQGCVNNFEGDQKEIVVCIEIEGLLNDIDTKVVVGRILDIFDAIKYIVEDQDKMLAALSELAVVVQGYSSHFAPVQIAEIVKFLKWLQSGSFIFMACVEYDFEQSDDGLRINRRSGEAMGVARGRYAVRGLHMLPDQVQHALVKQSVIDISKSERISSVYKRQYMNSIGIKLLDINGVPVGEKRFLGIFSPAAYAQDLLQMPIIKQKTKIILSKMRSRFPLSKYALAEIEVVIRSFPIDELLQHSVAYLSEVCFAILHNRQNPRLRLLASAERLQRFINCIVLVPRKHFHNKTVEIITRELESFLQAGALNCNIISDVESVRVQIELKTVPGLVSRVNSKKMEEIIANAILQWPDKVADLIIEHFADNAAGMITKYRNAFPFGYQENFLPIHAIKDIKIIDAMLVSGRHHDVSVYRSSLSKNTLGLKIYTTEETSISSIFLMIGNTGASILLHNHYNLNFVATKKVWLHYFALEVAGADINNNTIEQYQTALKKMLMGDIVNDSFNKLILSAGLRCCEVLLFRAIASYLKQINFRYDPGYIQIVLGLYPDAVGLLLRLFESRFNPEMLGRDGVAKRTMRLLKDKLQNIDSISEYTVIKVFLEVIMAMLRTNYYQNAACAKDYVSFKIRSSDISIMPRPLPFVEIFVFAPDVEGIHLRAGPVARGGLRWSDRNEDYRTEVLGLMRAQVTKNTVIIPTGAKGGFVIRDTSSYENVINGYKKFLRGLLDVTDNIVDGEIVPPKDVIRCDSNDPYLVVAADKGTAAFSDYANSVSLEYDFWLGDAFASGGSVGYDHKKLGITARGAWISVQQHLRRKGIDVERDCFTVVGIGDMSGDVFGNGMLLSKGIKLIAAFDHRHIFTDPNPDLLKSFEERHRLFVKPKSSWLDYNKNLISKGGGVFDRQSKLIKLSPEMRSALDTVRKECAPDELIRLILKAPVDLIWNGGIGTYIKGESETNEMVSDKTNDSCRINGREIRAKVFAEGGNLGVTQLGRIEYARNGGLINTDFIDNSAGVSCSDHEVNIKIALKAAMKSGKIDLSKRAELLDSMHENVSELVLRDNFEQNAAIFFAELQAAARLESDAFLMYKLEEDDYLDRRFESLPSKPEIDRMIDEGVGLSRPQICVLLSYTKLAVYDKLVSAVSLFDPYLQKYLIEYFPVKMQSEFKEEILSHQLSKEIIATYITNNVINYAGTSFLLSISEATSAEYHEIVYAYIAIRDMYGLGSLFHKIASEIHSVNSKFKVSIIRDVQFFIEHSTAWLLHHYRNYSIADTMNQLNDLTREACRNLESMMSAELVKSINKKCNMLISAGLSCELASFIATLWPMSYTLDIAQIYLKTNMADIKKVGSLYFMLDHALMVEWLRQAFKKVLLHSYWKKLVVKTLFYQMRNKKIELVCRLIESCKNDDIQCLDAETIIARYMQQNQQQFEKYLHFIAEIKNNGQLNIDMLDIAVKRFGLL